MKKISRGFLLLVFAASAVASVRSTARLPFIEDNYSKAFAEAKLQNLPVFVEVWAPW